nr:hypothetical protein [Lacticaseibacillus manihotivorans]
MGEYGIKYLTIRNVGTDNIDFEAAKKKLVCVSPTPQLIRLTPLPNSL